MNKAKLISLIKERKSYLCIGLDVEFEKIPRHILETDDPIFEFNKQIIDATRDLCVAYKPNTAFYEAMGLAGLHALERTIAYIGKEHFVIADAKRGDIGNTSTMYAKSFFEYYTADAVTVAPYMGEDSVKPFLAYKDKWAIVLGLTSNAGSSDFQLNALENGEMLYERVLKTVQTWGNTSNLMFVIGATHPDKLKAVRAIVPDHFLLVPGIGAQGGDVNAVSEAALNKDYGLLINSSRSIIYASSGLDFKIKVRAEAKKIQIEMEKYI